MSGKRWRARVVRLSRVDLPASSRVPAATARIPAFIADNVYREVRVLSMSETPAAGVPVERFCVFADRRQHLRCVTVGVFGGVVCMSCPYISGAVVLTAGAMCLSGGARADASNRGGWTQSYAAGYVDANGVYAGGSEIMHIVPHKGKLYAFDFVRA